ncbi:hypothetical protein D5R81_03575 [Parashewanella spongiae]|uniref:Uncharacterized protein n=1 Tax=Parashewanella spongiae TaxID=342950 RepID=A0A3A6UMB0_9GAMM|nr:hypothetical protein D5R81_03575 [Parashewanella spongiae]
MSVRKEYGYEWLQTTLFDNGHVNCATFLKSFRWFTRFSGREFTFDKRLSNKESGLLIVAGYLPCVHSISTTERIEIVKSTS